MKYNNFEESKLEAEKLIDNKKIDEAIYLYEDVINHFPDNYYEISIQLSLLYCLSQKHAEALAILIKGNAKGYSYSLPFNHEIYKPLHELKEYEAFSTTNEKIKKEKIAAAEAIYEISLPHNYAPDKKYPLFLALHGTGDNIDNFKQKWQSEKLAENYITAYIQSSKVYGAHGFSWDHECMGGRKDIEKCYEDIISKYPVDAGKVFIGGFSTGGMMALDITLNQVLPIKAFTVLCPIKPVTMDDDAIKNSVFLGIKGTVIVGTADFMLPVQKRIVNSFQDNGLQVRYREVPGLDHEIPGNLAELLDEMME